MFPQDLKVSLLCIWPHVPFFKWHTAWPSYHT